MEKPHPIILALNELGRLEWWRAHKFFEEGFSLTTTLGRCAIQGAGAEAG